MVACDRPRRIGENVLAFDAEAAQVWGRLRVPHPEHLLDKQIAAVALVYDLAVVTRNTADFEETRRRHARGLPSPHWPDVSLGSFIPLAFGSEADFPAWH
jgi:hypothetical protein